MPNLFSSSFLVKQFFFLLLLLYESRKTKNESFLSKPSYGQVKEKMRQEFTSSAEAMKSHSELLQEVKEMERVVETERRQVGRNKALRVPSMCKHQPTRFLFLAS